MGAVRQFLAIAIAISVSKILSLTIGLEGLPLRRSDILAMGCNLNGGRPKMSVTCTDPQQFSALLGVMGKSYQYRKFIGWCTSVRLNQVACSYWTNPSQRMAVSVEVIHRKSGWKLVSADFAIADKWMESRKAVRELNELVEARYSNSQWIKKDLSRKKKAVAASK